MFLSYPDHHNYSNQDIQRIKQDLKIRVSLLLQQERTLQIYKKQAVCSFILDVEHKIDDTQF